MTRWTFARLAGLAFWAMPLVAPAAEVPDTNWPDYGGGPTHSKFVALDQITRTNVAQLAVAWTYPSGDERAYQFNPVVVDGVMYVLAKNSSLVALDVTTGRELWIHANLRGIARRGINYWESADRSDRRLLFMLNNTLQAIDARTGKSILSFGHHGAVDLRDGLGRDPATIWRASNQTPGAIFENLLILGMSPGEGYFSAPGHLRAYNVVTGELAWTFHTIPQPGEFGYDTWPKDAYKYVGGVNCWGEMTVDPARGILYVPLGSPTYDYYGADRVGANLFADCLLALDARTGRRLWHFQTVHHDLWDYDLTAAPQLVTVRHDGKTVDAVVAASKQGFLFVFDRVTGRPLWPIAERPVPPSDVPGEQAWPTQPFPTVVPPAARQGMTAADVTSILITPQERADWQARIDRARKGLYTPPGLEETLAVPGAVGGTNWGNTAANPAAGIVYLLNQDFPSFYKLEPRPPERFRRLFAGGKPDPAAIKRGQEAYTQNCQVCHGPDRAGSDAGPSLLGIGNRISLDHLHRIITYGNGRMPPLPHVADSAISDLLAFLGGGASPFGPMDSGTEEPLPEGPVVASGGAPGGEEATKPRPYNRAGEAYPPGVDAPAVRYYTDYGLGHPYLMQPPWSQILAYDLNTGTLKWRKPLGQDRDATKAGATGTGVPRGSQRNGMIVTSTGLVFSTAKDGHVYAFDADNGDVLWSAPLPMGTEGLPAMYAANGKQYLVVVATTPLTWGLSSRESGIGSAEPLGQGGYVVFALPDATKGGTRSPGGLEK